MSKTLADVLRDAADLLAAHPNLPAPYITTSSHLDKHGVTLNWYLTIGREDLLGEQKSLAALIVSAIDGEWAKIPDAYEDFHFLQSRDDLELRVAVKREAVCQRIVTGVETVEVPATPAVAARTEERETVEWRCEPLLAGAGVTA